MNIKDQNFYLHKSRNQRIIGWSTLGGGILAGLVGVLLASGDRYYENTTPTIVLIISSAASGLTSIPFMILAHVNKRKASVAVSNQKTAYGFPYKAGMNITGVTLALSFGK